MVCGAQTPCAGSITHGDRHQRFYRFSHHDLLHLPDQIKTAFSSSSWSPSCTTPSRSLGVGNDTHASKWGSDPLTTRGFRFKQKERIRSFTGFEALTTISSLSFLHFNRTMTFLPVNVYRQGDWDLASSGGGLNISFSGAWVCTVKLCS